MTIKDVQEVIFNDTGLKTSVKSYSKGSMKGYVRVFPIYQNGEYPNMPTETVSKLRDMLSDFDYENKPLFCSTSEVNVYGIEDNRINYKKERKKTIESCGQKTWGSKNSQMRLDKAAARYAKLLSKYENRARYY